MDISRARRRPALLAVSLCLAQLPTAIQSAPLILEEATRIAPPESTFPLNSSVAIHGNSMIVSSRRFESPETHRFAAYIYERASASAPWSFAGKLIEQTVLLDGGLPPLAVALQGTLAVVAAYDNAYVFERGATGWTQTAHIVQSERRGFSDVAISAGRIVMGTDTGRQTANVYQKNESGQWALAEQLFAGGVFPIEFPFGPDLDIFGDKIVIGSPNTLNDPPDEPGSTWVFRQQDASWLQLDRLATGPLGGAADPQGSYFDAGRTAIFNDIAHTAFLGGVTTFEQTVPDQWSRLNHLFPVDGLMNRRSVGALDLGPGPTQDLVAFGEPLDDDRWDATPFPPNQLQGTPAGSVTLAARRADGNRAYAPVAKLLPSTTLPNLRLGQHISLHRDTLIASSARDLFVFRLPRDISQPNLRQDDFEDGNFAGWNVRSSVWSVVSSLGSRVFRQTLNTGEALALLDGVDWTNQSIQTDVRPRSAGGSEWSYTLVARYVDENNFYFARHLSSGAVRLGKRVAGVETFFGAIGAEATLNRDYRIRLESIGRRLRLYVNGRLQLEGIDNALSHGMVGLRTSGVQADFDNIVVSPSPAITLWADDFQDGDLVDWRTLSPQANWSNVAVSTGRVIRQSVASGDARAITGVPTEQTGLLQVDQIVEARARPLSFISGQDPWFGLIARYRDDRNYTYITVNRNGYISLRKLVNGVIQVFDTTSMNVTAGTWYRLRLEAIGERLRVYANDRLVLEGVDSSVNTTVPGALYGLMTSRASAEFDDVKVVQP